MKSQKAVGTDRNYNYKINLRSLKHVWYNSAVVTWLLQKASDPDSILSSGESVEFIQGLENDQIMLGV